MIVGRNDSYSVVDRNRSHGTFLNGVRVSGLSECRRCAATGSLEGPQLQFHFET